MERPFKLSLEKEEGGDGGLGGGDSRSKGPEVVRTSYTQELRPCLLSWSIYNSLYVPGGKGQHSTQHRLDTRLVFDE